MLTEISLEGLPSLPLTPAANEFLRDGRARMKKVKCFDFVPSNYENAWRMLSQLERGRFCEWGSGMGIVAGLAELLGFDATGVELDADLAESARALLHDHGLKSEILTGDYFEIPCAADVVYVYGWPGQLLQIEEHFCETYPASARLLMCYGQEDLRCMAR